MLLKSKQANKKKEMQQNSKFQPLQMNEWMNLPHPPCQPEKNRKQDTKETKGSIPVAENCEWHGCSDSHAGWC